MHTENLLSKNILHYGSSIPLPAQIPLQAGPLQMIYESGSLRYIKAGEIELVRMIYVALRDKRWGTYIPHISDEKLDIQPDSFSISYTCTYFLHKQAIFVWHAKLRGDASGTVYFEMDGKAEAAFEKNRLGICVLHPVEPLKNKRITIMHPDHSQTAGIFPELVSPHQPFKNIREIQYFPGENYSVSMQFAGDIFEMEDQRNWTDASYKTYSTPLTIPFPATVKKGDTVFQSVSMQLHGSVTAKTSVAVCTLFPDWNKTSPLPDIGIKQSSEYDRLNEKQTGLLKNCGFHHYRVDVKIDEPNWKDNLQRALQEAKALQTGVELSVHWNDIHELRAVLDAILPDQLLITSLILYFLPVLPDANQQEEWIQLCKQQLPQANIGIGTKGFFADVNRNRPGEGMYDFIVFSVNPQVHAFDQSTMIENLEAQKYPIETIHSFVKNKEIHISPLELRMNFAPEEFSEDILPFQIDSRQMSLFAAGWTLGSLKYLAESGVASVTCFETVGKRGIIAGEQENIDKTFPALPDMIYPVYYIFRELAPLKHAAVIACSTHNPLQVSGLLLRKDKQLTLFLANHTKEEMKVDLTKLGQQWKAKPLNATTLPQALSSLAVYDQIPVAPVENQLTLAAFACYILHAECAYKKQGLIV